ncbi:unnamed protein product [Caenorhabditis auriculariae]|uniref:Uncharacterized protein n=1 Tax=Caenorhabditis auriculariae TaxID=2777116 RepID=A0A8S1H2F2_9PELO|nr:unnamed protein product [Caenorhabditis auriculariae]
MDPEFDYIVTVKMERSNESGQATIRFFPRPQFERVELSLSTPSADDVGFKETSTPSETDEETSERPANTTVILTDKYWNRAVLTVEKVEFGPNEVRELGLKSPEKQSAYLRNFTELLSTCAVTWSDEGRYPVPDSQKRDKLAFVNEKFIMMINLVKRSALPDCQFHQQLVQVLDTHGEKFSENVRSAIIRNDPGEIDFLIRKQTVIFCLLRLLTRMSDSSDPLEQFTIVAKENVPASVQFISGEELRLWNEALLYVYRIDLQTIELKTNIEPEDMRQYENLARFTKYLGERRMREFLLPGRSVETKLKELIELNNKFNAMTRMFQSIGERNENQQKMIDRFANSPGEFQKEVQSAIDKEDPLEVDVVLRKQIIHCVLLNMGRKIFWNLASSRDRG